jgi:hypothetical protein
MAKAAGLDPDSDEVAAAVHVACLRIHVDGDDDE